LGGQRCGTLKCKLERTKNTCLKKYNSNSPLQNKTIIKKIKNTNIKRYGAETPFQSKIIQDKIRNSTYDKYGKYPEELMREEFKNKYGVISPFSLKLYQEKSKDTKIKKYNDVNYNNMEKMKQTKLERYKDKNYNNYLQGQITCFKNHGKNQIELMNEAQGIKRSSLEIIIENLLSKYGFKFKPYFSLKENKKIRFYDFKLLNTDVLIECDGTYWHSLPDRIKNDKYKNLLAKNNGYNIIRFKEVDIRKENFEELFLNKISDVFGSSNKNNIAV